jgi:hypothetical protein
MFPSKTALAKQPRAVGIGGCAAQASAPGGDAATAFGALAPTAATISATALTCAERLAWSFEAINFLITSPFGYGLIEVELDAGTGTWTAKGVGGSLAVVIAAAECCDPGLPR